MWVKSTVISARPNWMGSIDKRGNSIQSLSMTYQEQQGATETGLFSLAVSMIMMTTSTLVPIFPVQPVVFFDRQCLRVRILVSVQLGLFVRNSRNNLKITICDGHTNPDFGSLSILCNKDCKKKLAVSCLY